MKIYNDCPLCAHELKNYIEFYSYLSCSGCCFYKAQIAFYIVEEFYIEKYIIRRMPKRTTFLTPLKVLIHCLEKSLNFNKFNTVQKIENLLALI